MSPIKIGDQPPLPKNVVSINGTVEEAIERFKIRELAEGWMCHRDACEWDKYRALFSDDAVVFTTWSGGKHIDDFIETSKKGFHKGDFIMHRANGATVDLATSGPGAGTRAVAKIKATITQRFNLDGCWVDIENDCRFVWFVLKDKEHNNDWKARWVKLFYEKDKVIPVDPSQVPQIDQEELKKYPEGYRYLAYGQAKLGYPILQGLPERYGEAHDELYVKMQEWLDGKNTTL